MYSLSMCTVIITTMCFSTVSILIWRMESFSTIQNGEITYLSMMSDQEITEYFNSSNIIVFYTPKGLEIGFNYDEGWVTVTYEDYEQYLKVF